MRAQKQELVALRQQVSGGTEMSDPGMPANEENEWIDIENDHNLDLDDGYKHEVAVAQELGLPASNSTWANRLSRENEAWEAQLPALCDAYLSFRAGVRPSLDSEINAELQSITLQCISVKSAYLISCSYMYITMLKLILPDESIQSFSTVKSDLWVNVMLLRHGYLAPTPSHPTTAILLELLDIISAVQRCDPSVSIQVMAKAFSDLCNVCTTIIYKVESC
jgi:hypothetical protein